jgi:Protein of unknown function (DUF4241)
MTRIGLAATALALASGAVQAEPNGTVIWILKQHRAPLVVQEVGTYSVRGNALIGVDSLTYSPTYNLPWFKAPTGPARVVAFDDPQEYALSKAAILFSDAAPVCGEEVGAMPVDTGTGAFLDRPTAETLDRVSAAMGPDCNLYDCLMAEQVAEAQFARMIRLPDGSTFPAFSTGFGDGVYPVFLLYDADGLPVAAYADFLGVGPDYQWLAPPACPKPVS